MTDAQTAWRTIESAPRDGTRVIAYWPHIGQPVVAWVAQGGIHYGTWTCSILPTIKVTPRTPPTHWMAIPDAPRDSDEHRNGEDAKRLRPEGLPARAVRHRPTSIGDQP
jgi:hypothetical protein